MIGAMLAILGAIETEVADNRRLLEDPVALRAGRLTVHRGRLHGVEVLLARCGVGKVNAAMATTVLHSAGATSLLFTGVAGGVAPGQRVGDLVVATDLVQHDVDVTPLGRPPGQLLGEPLSWAADPAMSRRLTAAAGARAASDGRTLHEGRVASGDQFVASAARAADVHAEFGAVCVEMEGAAVAQAATSLGLPFAVLRALSDTADHGAAQDFPAFLTGSARLMAEVVEHYLRGDQSKIAL
ncbi:5'-methylthioadenosine nucleosidase [Serinicoccus chungangensis]|uniref:adenosylhomocysteine nucleosidase n=2 Tax=Serinicoccus chungangensis TaxID=767452 RepID=A0A0W8I501_9MICO|nr:5'-methylthioadenosine nucleosidase [Serinicoccus chungangensis]